MRTILLIVTVYGGAHEVEIGSEEACFDALQTFNLAAHSIYGSEEDRPFMAVCIKTETH